MVENYQELLYDHETLDAERIRLRKFQKADADDLLAIASDEETVKYLKWKGVKTLEQAKQQIIEHYWPRQGIFAIELKENQKCIGAVSINLMPEHEKAGFGYMLNRCYWGKGYMTEALGTVIRFCFEQLDVSRVEASHYAGNEASGKVMQKCGMVFEGVGKREEIVKGEFRDVVHYALLKEDWGQAT